MLVRSYGISVKAENAEISLDALFASLELTSGQEDASLSNTRRIFLDTKTNTDFALGLVVTVKDQKKFCELVNDRGNFIISVTNLHGDNKLMEFNLFVINKKNGFGIYQHYFQSCSPNTFGTYLRARYRRLTDSSRDSKIANLKDKNKNNISAEKAIRSAHRNGLSFSLLIHKDSLESVLSRFKEIRAFEYEFSAVEPNILNGAPITSYVRRVRQKVSFHHADVGVLSKAIQKTVNIIKPKSGHVSVVERIDDEDIPMSVRIADIPEHFGEQDYDSVAVKLNQMDTATFATHVVIGELLDACAVKYKHVFMKTVRDKSQ